MQNFSFNFKSLVGLIIVNKQFFMLILLNKSICRSFSFVQKLQQNLKASSLRAHRVQQNVFMENYTAQNQAKLRKKISIQSSVDQLQKQMNQEIARSLKCSEDKVTYMIQRAQKMHKQLIKLQKHTISKQISEYNSLVDMCQKVRWKFMVHRQSCGFTIKNHELVHSLYQIPPKIV